MKNTAAVNNTVNCPYCGVTQGIDPEDGYKEDERYDMQCADCYKFFTYIIRASYTYVAEKADCLNEGENKMCQGGCSQ